MAVACERSAGLLAFRRMHSQTSNPNSSSMPITINVGHSPDPDDAFMFHALANGKIPTGNYRFTHTLQDIETLNHRAFRGELELTAVACMAMPTSPTSTRCVLAGPA